MAAYAWNTTGSGKFYDAKNWNNRTTGQVPADSPPQPSDTANIFTGTAQADGDVSTASGGKIIVSFAGTLDVGGSLIDGSAGSGSISLTNNSTLEVAGPLVIGQSAGANGSLTLTGAGTTGTAGQATVGGSGTGTLSLSSGATFQISGSLKIGQKASGSSVTVDGGNSQLTVSTLSVGGQTATATGNPNNPWSYNGGTGTLTISNNGSVADGGSLKLRGGTISIKSNGALEIGGSSGANAGTLQVDSDLKGHGTIASDASGSTKVGNTSTPTYSLKITNNGTIE